MHISGIPMPYIKTTGIASQMAIQFTSSAVEERCPPRTMRSISPHKQQMLLGTRECVTTSSKGEKHAHCASICAEERKPGKQQILDILKALVHEQ